MACIELYQAMKKCLSTVYTHVENGGDFAVQREGNVLKLFFEWSDGKEDWKNNFDFPAKPYRHMKHLWFCHRGFLKVWKSIEPHLAEEISRSEINKIEIVGYSHGAAIGLLCYEYCIFNRPECDVQGVGFGCPRVFWGFVPKKVKERFKNYKVVRNGNDIVTHVPPVLFGFRHISEKVKIGESKSKGALKDFFSCMRHKDKTGMKEALIRLVCAKDHYPEEYEANLK